MCAEGSLRSNKLRPFHWRLQLTVDYYYHDSVYNAEAKYVDTNGHAEAGTFIVKLECNNIYSSLAYQNKKEREREKYQLSFCRQLYHIE